MSNISSRHSIVEFDSKTSKAYEGQRLAKVGYKTSKTGKKSQCASIPRITANELTVEVLQAFRPQLLGIIENAQDAIVKEAYEANRNEVTDEEVSLSACIAYLDSEAKGDRLTKEIVIDWFNTSLADTLMLAFAEKLAISDNPTDAQSKQIETAVTMYRDKFASLSGSKTFYAPEVVEKLEKALEFAESADAMVARLQKKLAGMKEQPSVQMLGL